jgi:2,3-dihydro-2,3-dihydroxybenzoate dehydrogenase
VSKAVVIGGARGIGEAVSRTLAGQHWVDELLIGDLDGQGAEALASELDGSGVSCAAAQVDIADTEATAELARSAGDASYLAIVAGKSETPQFPLAVDELRRIVGVNLVGVYAAAQAFAQPMMDRGLGSIVAVASVNARVPRKNLAAYCSSKAALVMSLRVLAMECAPKGVRVNTVSPGAVDLHRPSPYATATGIDLISGSLEWSRLPVQDGRRAEPRDIANAVAFLLGPLSGHILLEDLVVDGGELLGLGG